MRYVGRTDRPDPHLTRRTDEHTIHETTPTLRLPFASNPHKHTAAMHPSKRAANNIGHAGTTQAHTGTARAHTGNHNRSNRHRASGTNARALNESRDGARAHAQRAAVTDDACAWPTGERH